MSELIEIWKSKKSNTRKERKSFLKKCKSQPSKKLDELAEQTHEEVFQELDCLDCANCCSSIPPIVNKTDANRLAKHLGMKLAKFEAEYLTTDEDGDRVMNATPCPFLQEDHKCFVYEYRPKACREYPHTNSYEFSKHLKLHEKNALYCPAVFHILERMQQAIFK